MALKYNNNYYRIIKITKNILTQTTIVELGVYVDKETRDLEKSLYPKYQSFLDKALSRVNSKHTELLAELDTLRQHAVATGLNVDETLFNSQVLRELHHLYSSLSSEFSTIKQNLLINEIDINSLNFKELWIEDGLDSSLCVKANYAAVIQFELDCFTDDLNVLYTELKNKHLLGGVDC